MVFLEADPKRVDDENATRVTDGKYSFRAIRPGKYRLLAIDMLQLMSTTTDGAPEDFKQFFDAADEVEIKEGDRITKDITAFTKIPEKK